MVMVNEPQLLYHISFRIKNLSIPYSPQIILSFFCLIISNLTGYLTAWSISQEHVK